MAKKPGDVPPGSLAEQAVWDAIAKKPGWSVAKQRVYVTDHTGQVRVYDGAATSPSGRNIGIEVKSGSAMRDIYQRQFDLRLNSSSIRGPNGIGRYECWMIRRAIEVHP